MSNASATLIPTALTNQTQVQISVRGGKLDFYPKRAHDVLIYHVAPRHRAKASPTKPHEVRWVVEGMTPGQAVAIETDPGQPIGVERVQSATVISARRVQVLRFAGPGVHTDVSGPPTAGPGAGHERTWKYDIVLYQGGKVIDRIDPTVIIKEDP